MNPVDAPLDAFISYCSRDEAEIEFITGRLRREQVRYWRDLESVLAGDDFVSAIQEALTRCRCVLICIGKVLGPWQETEMTNALARARAKRGFRVIPVLLPGAGEVPALLQSLAHIDFRGGYADEREWERLLAAILDRPPTVGNRSGPAVTERRAVGIGLINQGCVLLLRRRADAVNAPHVWQLPGGKVGPNETAAAAAVREVHEETGVVVETGALGFVTDLLDAWLFDGGAGSIRMSLFVVPVGDRKVSTRTEHDASCWLPLDHTLPVADPEFPLLGATGRALRILRRNVWLQEPLERISGMLERKGWLKGDESPELRVRLETILSLLGVLGLVDDSAAFGPSSSLSAALVRTLAAWSLTDAVVFPNAPNAPSGDMRMDDRILARYRHKAFEEHEALLAMISYRLTRSVRSRRVADLLLARTSGDRGKLLLLRWDLVSGKFQIPAKGLEDAPDGHSEQAARYAFGRRFAEPLADRVNYRYLGDIVAQHVSSGGLEDGPIMKNYNVELWIVTVPGREERAMTAAILAKNRATLSHLSRWPRAGKAQRRELCYYVWVPIRDLFDGTFQREHPVQGFEELVDSFGVESLESLPAMGAAAADDEIPIAPIPPSALPGVELSAGGR